MAMKRRGWVVDHLGSVQGSVEEGFLLADVGGVIRSTNAAAERLLGGPVRSLDELRERLLDASGQTPRSIPGPAEELRLHVRKRLSAHAYPREIQFVEQLPKTPSGKLQRFILRNMEKAAVS